MLVMVGLVATIQAYQTKEFHHHHSDRFDSDSFLVAVDTYASRTMTNRLDLMKGDLEPVTVPINGINGASNAIYKGSISLTIEDDTGVPFQLEIKDAYYSPDLPCVILPPQHWSQTAPYPVQAVVGRNALTLCWGTPWRRKTIPYCHRSNVPTLRANAGFQKFQAYATLFQQRHTPTVTDKGITVFAAQQDLPPCTNGRGRGSEVIIGTHREGTVQSTNPLPPVTFNLNDTTTNHEAPNHEATLKNPTHELLRWHAWLGHMSFARLKVLALKGELPKSILQSKKPMCAACEFGKATRRQWRQDKSKKKGLHVATQPGQVVSIDQLESRTPGLIAQTKGRPTRARYHAATIFVDHYSRYSYVHLQQDVTANSTVQAKEAFEAHAQQHGIKVQHYHSDNGRFAETAFRNHARQRGQTISFCGVNAHFQNGIAEKRIRDLQDQARTMLSHAKHQWPSAITANLWPYALRMANEVNNAVPRTTQSISPCEQFFASQVAPRLTDFHSFGCPAYVLNNTLQAGTKQPKWMDRSRVGISLDTPYSMLDLSLSS